MRTGLNRDAWDSAVRKAYAQRNKNSSGVRTLEEIKKEMDQNEKSIKDVRESIEDYDSGWADDSSNNPRKRVHMEQRLESLKEDHAKLTEEYENHPDYYADKYKDVGGVRKAVTGIVGSTIATVPVVAETASAAIKEAERKLESDAYTSALQEEKIAWNKMNDYAASYFGSFDTIDEDELDRLKQEHDRAVDYRKSLEAQYEQPVDMDSWGMDLMEEATWLKDSATKNLNGFWKPVADTVIDIGQDVALLPLLAGGPKTYIAGVAANNGAEDMFEQTTDGKSAGDALISGGLTAGAEVAKGKIADLKIPVDEVIGGIGVGGTSFVEKFLKEAFPKVTKEMVSYFLDFLTDKARRDPEAKFSIGELIQSGAANGITEFFGKKTDRFFDILDEVWSQE